jgi:hypothetical protein
MSKARRHGKKLVVKFAAFPYQCGKCTGLVPG